MIKTLELKKIAKKYAPYVISGFIGSIITLLTFPIQKEIEYSFWKRQDQQTVRRNIIENRLNILNDFVVEVNRYRWCSIRAGVIEVSKVIEEDPIVCYHDSSNKLLGIAFKVKYYYGEDVNTKFDEISKAIQDYEKEIKSGKILDPDVGNELNEKFLEAISLMQKHMLSDLNYDWLYKNF